MASRERAIESRRKLSAVIEVSLRTQPQCKTQVAEYLGLTSASIKGDQQNYLTWSLIETDLVDKLQESETKNNVCIDEGDPVQGRDFFREQYRRAQPVLSDLVSNIRDYIKESPDSAYNSSIAKNLGLETATQDHKRENYFTWSLLQMINTQGIVELSGERGYRNSKPYRVVDSKPYQAAPFIYDVHKRYASKNESLVAQRLTEAGIRFIPQKRFPECRYRGLLSFDFYFPDYSSVNEVQGIQHYEYTPWFHETEEEFQVQRIIDNIKVTFSGDQDMVLYITDCSRSNPRQTLAATEEMINHMLTYNT